MNRFSAVGVALVQGGFYAVTGVWALVDLDSFMAVTGPKTDLRLVKTVGALVTVIGGVLLTAGWRRRVTRDVLLDASAEVGPAIAWALARRR
jgi:predicted anti-sigma-YlaC factor YlaD